MSAVRCGRLPETLLTLRPTGLPCFEGDCGDRNDRVVKRLRSHISKLVILGSREMSGVVFASAGQFELISGLLLRRNMREKNPCFFCGDDVLEPGLLADGERLFFNDS